MLDDEKLKEYNKVKIIENRKGFGMLTSDETEEALEVFEEEEEEEEEVEEVVMVVS